MFHAINHCVEFLSGEILPLIAHKVREQLTFTHAEYLIEVVTIEVWISDYMWPVCLVLCL